MAANVPSLLWRSLRMRPSSAPTPALKTIVRALASASPSRADSSSSSSSSSSSNATPRYDPYRSFAGKRKQRRSNNNNNDEDNDDDDGLDFDESDDYYDPTEARQEKLADKSWPATTGTKVFADLINASGELLPEEQQQKIYHELFRRIGHTTLAEVQLPEMRIQVPEDHPDREALEIMKLSLMNNGRILMDDKDEILEGLIDELTAMHKDKTVLIQPVRASAAETNAQEDEAAWDVDYDEYNEDDMP